MGHLSSSGCLVCGIELRYTTEKMKQRCLWCGQSLMTNTSCPNGHYICDTCHAKPALEFIQTGILHSLETDPLKLADRMMHYPSVHMHGPEHHFLVPAVLVGAFANSTGNTDRKEDWLQKARDRSTGITGGFCGIYGTCGAAVGTGIFLSIVTNNTPLSEESWGMCQELTSQSLHAIASKGGPRCCKRDSFLSVQTAVRFVNDRGLTSWPESDITCSFSAKNAQCIQGKCPFYGGKLNEVPDPEVF